MVDQFRRLEVMDSDFDEKEDDSCHDMESSLLLESFELDGFEEANCNADPMRLKYQRPSTPVDDITQVFLEKGTWEDEESDSEVEVEDPYECRPDLCSTNSLEGSCDSGLGWENVTGGQISRPDPDIVGPWESRSDFCSASSCCDDNCGADDALKIAGEGQRAYEDLSKEELNEILANMPCPKCLNRETSRVELGEDKKQTRENPATDELTVRYCNRCDSCFGPDDTMDPEDLQRLFEHNKITVKPKTICKCGNDDVDKFIIRSIDESTGRPVVECRECWEPVMMDTVDDGTEEDEDWDFGDPLNCEREREALDLHHHQPTVLMCKGCQTREDGLFDKNFDHNGRLKFFRCQSCDCENHVTHVWNPVCPVCRNDDRNQFQITTDGAGREISAACQRCLQSPSHPEQHSDDPCPKAPTPEKPVTIRRRMVTSLDDVKVGDHVAWHRDYVMWHHAIVTEVKSRDRTMTVVHYTGGLKKHRGHYASVREEDVEVNLNKEKLFVYDYDGCPFNPVDVIERARSRLGEDRYNLVKRNCEHFVRWCKTGDGYSNQVKSFCRRLWKTGGTALSGVIREGVVSTCRGVLQGLSAKQILGVGYKRGLFRLKESFGGAGGAGALKGGAIVFDVFLNLALEIGMFAYCAVNSHRKYKSNEITKTQFKRELCQSGCECTGGFIGSVGGGFLGQLAIPVPFLGSVIGCTLGTLIGRFLGSIVGKKIADKFFDEK